jgi:transketolase
MRATYNDTLIELAEQDERVVVLEADLMKASGTVPFKERFPQRTFDMGVAEANMAGVASGLSSVGKIPFAASFTSFAGRKTYDQFFISANYAHLNVKLTGTDPGITAAYNGGTHMSLEDGGIMRNIPGLVVFEPADNVSLAALVRKAYEHRGCTYMRLHRKGGNALYDESRDFELGKGIVLRDGGDITLIATGFVLVPEALAAAEELAKEGIEAAVIDMHTVKPIDRELIVEYARKTGAIVTCENHQIVNYLGSAVAETLAEEQPALLSRVGVNEEFGEVGTLDYLKERFGMTAAHIADRARTLLEKKR